MVSHITKTNVSHGIYDKPRWERKRAMNIQKYMAFVKAAEFGSFTKAAEALDYTQSGISRMINDLETEWGFPFLKEAVRVSV